jgi:hypothetical protein
MKALASIRRLMTKRLDAVSQDGLPRTRQPTMNNAADPERVLLKSNETTDEAVLDRVTGDRQNSTQPADKKA